MIGSRRTDPADMLCNAKTLFYCYIDVGGIPLVRNAKTPRQRASYPANVWALHRSQTHRSGTANVTNTATSSIIDCTPCEPPMMGPTQTRAGMPVRVFARGASVMKRLSETHPGAATASLAGSATRTCRRPQACAALWPATRFRRRGGSVALSGNRQVQPREEQPEDLGQLAGAFCVPRPDAGGNPGEEPEEILPQSSVPEPGDSL